MKLPRIKKKAMIIGLAGGLAMGVGGIAAAFLTATGSGAGVANVTPASSVIINGHISSLQIGHTRHVHLTITNPDGTTSLGYVSVTLTTPTGCPTGSFTVTRALTPLGTVHHGHTSLGSGSSTHRMEPTVTFNDLTVTQNTCTGQLRFRVFTSS